MSNERNENNILPELTVEEYREFLSSLDDIKTEFWTSEKELFLVFIDNLNRFKERKEEEENEEIQNAIAILNKYGYSAYK